VTVDADDVAQLDLLSDTTDRPTSRYQDADVRVLGVTMIKLQDERVCFTTVLTVALCQVSIDVGTRLCPTPASSGHGLVLVHLAPLTKVGAKARLAPMLTAAGRMSAELGLGKERLAAAIDDELGVDRGKPRFVGFSCARTGRHGDVPHPGTD
jgi:hypothetical protein